MREVRDRRGLSTQDVEAVGISCGGPLDSRAGLVLGPPNLPGWDDVPVVAELSRAAGRPAYLQNDANAGALAEWKFGAGRGTQNMIFITAGTGFGAGLILDGRLYSGTNDMAGEIGHVRLERYGPFAYGKTGSVDGLCGGAGIAQVARERMDLAARRGEHSLLFMHRGDITARVVAEAAAEGDELAARVLQQAGEYWGQALAILVDVLNPQRIVMGSLGREDGRADTRAGRRGNAARGARPQRGRVRGRAGGAGRTTLATSPHCAWQCKANSRKPGAKRDRGALPHTPQGPRALTLRVALPRERLTAWPQEPRAWGGRERRS